MKKVFKHPLVVIISFMMILIGGEQFGGLYILYLALGLSHAAAHSIIGILGTSLLLFNLIRIKRWRRSYISTSINLAGVIMLWISLFLFFFGDKNNYNISTFYELVPQIMLILFSVISLYFFVANTLTLLNNSRDNHYLKHSAFK